MQWPLTPRALKTYTAPVNPAQPANTPSLTFRPATRDDCPKLAELNHQLIRDEGHPNPMTLPDLEQRLRNWLAGEYQAVIYEQAGEVVAYALYREQPTEIYLRQLFVVRHHRREGVGRRAVEILHTQIWPKTKRLTVEVLSANHPGVAFWRQVGYKDCGRTANCLLLEIVPDSPPASSARPTLFPTGKTPNPL